MGFALESDIYSRRLDTKLFAIYSNPSLDAIKTLHDRLLKSENHMDREKAFWLELALDQEPAKVDLGDVTLELNEMEILLADLLWKVEESSQRDFNDWMNYISNVPQSIQHGFGIDAKILMSMAAQQSTKDSIENNKLNPDIWYRIQMLQQETVRIFEEVKKIPLKLAVSEERLDALIELQGALIELLKKRYLETGGKEVEAVIGYPIQWLESAQKGLMKTDTDMGKVKREIEAAHEYLQQKRSDISDKNFSEWTGSVADKVRLIPKKLP